MLDVQKQTHGATCCDQFWSDVISDMDVGLLLYDPVGKLMTSNRLVQPLLRDDDRPSVIDSVEHFLQYMFDHAVPAYEIPDVVKKYAASRDQRTTGFYEVIQTPGALFLSVSIKLFPDGRRGIFLYDMTHFYEQQKDREELSWQHYALLQAVEHGQTGVALYNPRQDGQPIVFSNHAFLSMVHASRDQVLGTAWQDILPDIKGANSYRVMVQADKDHKVFYGCQVSELDDLGIIFMADITALNEKEDQVRHMQKLEQLGQLAGGVAHDFNNILGIIRGYAHILKRHFGDDERVANALNSTLKACERGASLTDKLLTFSRKRINDPEATEFKRVMGMLESLLRVLIPTSIEFQVQVPDENVQLLCSEDHLMQIVMNLVVNARDASHEGGLIRVESQMLSGPDVKKIWPGAETDKSYIKLKVEDHGDGMSPDVLKRIYEPFFSTKDVSKGSGLGLSVVYGLMQQYGGHIDVVSQRGQGTTFTVFLPARAAAVDAVPVPAHHDGVNAGVDLKNRTIMVVDDEADLCHSIRLYFEDMGMKVIEASDADDALDKQDQYDGPIDLLLTDVRMPGMSGTRLADLWHDVRPDSRIMLMSGYPKGETGPVQADAFLAKPLDYNGMTTLIRQLVGRESNDQMPATTLRNWG